MARKTDNTIIMTGNCVRKGNRKSILIFFFLGSLSTGFAQENDQWISLFNGKDTQGWKAYNGDTISPNWSVEGGILKADGTKGDIITENIFRDFELTFEWKISKGGNSGIFYHVREDEVFTEVWRTGVEMQIVDNKNNPLGKDPKTSAGSLYALYPAGEFKVSPAGTWNTSGIKVFRDTVEYTINGTRVNKYVRFTKKWYNDREKSIHNSKRKPLWGEFRSGHIALQDEGFPVEYRNIRIRELNDETLRPGHPGFPVVTFLDENPPRQREGHTVSFLLNEWWGTTNGFNSIVVNYTAKEFIITGTHSNQEMFYLIEGYGWARVGEEVFPVYPGACWLVPPETIHGIKCAETSEGVKAFVVHGAK